jgi:uncharacterized protein (DUF58 family)
MTRSFEPKLVWYTALAAAGLLAALAARLPELVVLAAPFALVPALGVLLARGPEVEAGVELERERTLEGDELDVTVALVPASGAERVDVLLELPPGLALAEGGANPVAIHLPDRRPRELRFRVRCERWGGYAVGRVFLRARDPFALIRWEQEVDRRVPLKVYPREEVVRTLLRPLDTQVFSGNHVAREKGEGIEFADLRPFVPGDRVRRVNWRASARRGQLWVNEHHAERNADVVIFLDSFAELGQPGASTLDYALRAAASLAARYLRQKDRVGFVSFGGTLNWLLPSTGATQLYRIVDSLLDTRVTLNYAWKDLDIIPRRTLPPRALVLALSPLLDERAVSALLDVRGRGFDLSVIEISPLRFLPPADSPVAETAQRIWRLRREALRGRFERAGVPVAIWDEERPLAAALEEVTAFRQHARIALA